MKYKVIDIKEAVSDMLSSEYSLSNYYYIFIDTLNEEVVPYEDISLSDIVGRTEIYAVIKCPN